MEFLAIKNLKPFSDDSPWSQAASVGFIAALFNGSCSLIYFGFSPLFQKNHSSKNNDF